MNVRFTFWFVLDRKLKMLYLPYQGRDQALTAAKETILFSLLHFTTLENGDRGNIVLQVLGYKSEGRWFNPSCQWIFY